MAYGLKACSCHPLNQRTIDWGYNSSLFKLSRRYKCVGVICTFEHIYQLWLSICDCQIVTANIWETMLTIWETLSICEK